MGIFYSSFDVEVFSYVDTSEILLSFSDLIITLIIIFVITFPTYLILNSIKSAGTISVIRPRTNEETEFDYEIFQRHELKRSKRKTWKGFGISIILFIAIILLTYNTYPSNFDTELSIFFITALLIVFFYFALQPIKLNKHGQIVYEKQGRSAMLAFASIPFMFIYLGVRADRLAGYIRKHKMYNVSVLLNTGDSIKTDSTFIFVSSTKSYLFFWNKLDSVTTFIPKGDCRRINIKKC